jgi:hypothetical protein
MADWMRLFVLSPHVRVLVINEVPAGGDVPALRLEAKVFDHDVERRFPMRTQDEADYGFAVTDELSVAYWLTTEGAKREADHARCL